MKIASKLSDQVYRKLLSQIFADQLPAGTILSEVELAERFGVSRTPVREALRRLSGHGLVGIHAHHRATVNVLGSEALREVYQIREALEGMATERACGFITPSDFARLDELVAAIQKPGSPGKRESCARLDTELHRTIADRASNTLLAREIAKLKDLIQVVRARRSRKKGQVAAEFRQHVKIIEALRSCQPARARLAMIKHIRASSTL
jgi:DNA-binding GntR family transcriptional regulator